MNSIIAFIMAHMGASVASGSVLGALILHYAEPWGLKYVSTWLGKFMAKEINIVENIKTGDPTIDGMTNLSALTLMNIANVKMPLAAGEQKKKYLLSLFAGASPVVQAMVSTAIDQLWTVVKNSVGAGITPEQEAIIADAVARLAALPKTPSTASAKPVDGMPAGAMPALCATVLPDSAPVASVAPVAAPKA